MNRKLMMALVLVLLASLLLTSGVVAEGGNGNTHRNRLRRAGVVITLPECPAEAGGTGSLTINPRKGEPRTFAINDETIYKDPQGNALSCGDLGEYDWVKVYAVEQEDGSWLAQRVTLLVPRPIILKGWITVLGATSFEISGETTIAVNEETSYAKPGIEEATFGDLALDDYVRVVAKKQEDGSLLALEVVVVRPPRLTVKGWVSVIGEDSFDVQSGEPGEETTFTVDETTTFKKQGVGDVTFTELAIGDYVVVRAVQQLDGSWLATKVFIRQPPRILARGTVKEKSTQEDLPERTFTVEDRRGDKVFVVDDETRFVEGGEEASFETLENGDRVVAKGLKQLDGRYLAKKVVIRGPNNGG